MSTSLYALLSNTPDACLIVEELRQRGYRSDDISLLFPDKQTNHDFSDGTHLRATDGVPNGLPNGGVVGGSLGWLTGVGSLAIPGVGPFIAAGPIMMLLSRSVRGAAMGGIATVLSEMGITDSDAKRLEGKVREGNVLILVTSDEGAEIAEILDVFSAWGAIDMSSTRETPVPVSLHG